jgi:hypothetical protein
MDQARDSRMRSTRRRDCEPPLPEPLASFLTWPPYGTWLPGDERGWVEYRPRLATSRSRSQTRAAGPPEGSCLPSRPGPAPARRIDHCRSLPGAGVDSLHRQLPLEPCARHRGGRPRTQGDPGAVQSLVHPPAQGVALQQERLGPLSAHDSSAAAIRQKWWAERGSALYVNDEEGLEAVIHYVREAQDHADQPQPDERERSQS